MKAIAVVSHEPWNKGKLVGQKAPLRIRDIWAIRVRLQLAEKTRDLALLTWQSIASCAPAISPGCACGT